MIHRTILSIVLAFWSVFSTHAQVNTSLLIRTWKAVKFEEEDGRKFPVPPEMEKDYLMFNPDGTYQSLESGTLLIKGTWTLDPKKGTLVMKQNQTKNYPPKTETKIIRLTESELVMEGKDREGRKLIVYSKPKK